MAKEKKPCPPGSSRNPDTGRCRKDKKPCPPGKSRNRETGRCRNDTPTRKAVKRVPATRRRRRVASSPKYAFPFANASLSAEKEKYAFPFANTSNVNYRANKVRRNRPRRKSSRSWSTPKTQREINSYLNAYGL